MPLSVTEWMLTVASVGMPLVILYLRAIRGDVREFRLVVQNQLDEHRDRLDRHDERMQMVERTISSHGDHGKRLDRHDERIQAAEQHKVSHGDWVRVVTSQRHHLETTRELLREIMGKLDATDGVTGSLRRVADALVAKVD